MSTIMNRALAISLANLSGRFVAALKAKRAVRSKTEEALNKRLGSLFGSVQEKVVTGLEASAGRMSAEQAVYIVEGIKPRVEEAVFNAMVETTRGSGVPRELLKDRAFTASQSTMDRLSGDVISTLDKARLEGLSPSDTARMLEKNFKDMSEWERERIARTDINGANNLGNYYALRNVRIEYHQWWTARDDRVRDSHEELQGEIVKVGQPFSNGLRYPGDRDGDISEWINCRCTSVLFLMPVGMMAPWDGPFFETDLIEAPIPDGRGDVAAYYL